MIVKGSIALWWRRVTLRRHRSEVKALRLARKMGFLAIFPIFLNLMAWWFAFCLPAAVPGIAGLFLINQTAMAPWLLGGALYALASIYALIAVIAAAPWIFRWYFIAAGLMFGRTGMADKKEAELIAALDGADGGQ